MIHAVKGFGIVNKAEVDIFMELSCFFYDPMNVGNLIYTIHFEELKEKLFKSKIKKQAT